MNNIYIDRISSNNFSPVERSKFYRYLHALTDAQYFKIEYLLNTTHIDTHSVFERFIYVIACTQLRTKLNKQFNNGDNYITFGFIKNTCNEHIIFNRDEDSMMTSIVNLADCPCTPFLFVKLTEDEYIKKETKNIRECKLIVPKQGNIVTFDPSIYIYGNVNMFCNNDEIRNELYKFDYKQLVNYSLVIKILKQKPTYTPLFNYDIISAIVYQVHHVSKYELSNIGCENISGVSFSIDSITEDIFMNILLKKEKVDLLNILYNTLEFNVGTAFDVLSPILENHVETHLLFELKVDEPKLPEPKLPEPKLPEPKLIVDYSDKYDKFNQRFTHRSVFTSIMCDWIIDETEQYAFKHGWNTSRHDNYPTTDIELHNIQSVFSFMILFMQTVEKLICKSYSVKVENIDITEMFIAKYDEKQQNSLDMHKDGNGSNISISILLNDGFDGGDLIYEDGITSHAEKGDMVIHTQRHVHGVTPVTKGVRYSLILFLQIKFSV